VVGQLLMRSNIAALYLDQRPKRRSGCGWGRRHHFVVVCEQCVASLFFACTPKSCREAPPTLAVDFGPSRLSSPAVGAQCSVRKWKTGRRGCGWGGRHQIVVVCDWLHLLTICDVVESTCLMSLRSSRTTRPTRTHNHSSESSHTLAYTATPQRHHTAHHHMYQKT
jgi:hypothetical protein